MSRIITALSRPEKWGAMLLAGGAAFLGVLALVVGTRTHAQGEGDPEGDEAKVRIGLLISPVELDLEGKNPALVGLGSYIVNAQAQCSNCHTQPQFAPGGNPFLGQPEVIPADSYLGGGRLFPVAGGVTSRNITPEPDTGLPAGLTFEEFVLVMRTGIDLDNAPPHVPSVDNDLLQVMQWPVFRNMSDRDLRAVYEYLRAIPSVP
ncbi:MAG TPA: hypothetical protein VMP01_14815 [Pirellulaceae bacterium]|nr:hypothetical protein [Pirellulaceae bacterium]